MAYTQADLDALDELIATGATEIEYEGGKRVRVAPLEQLMARRRLIAEALGIDTNPPAVVSETNKAL